MSPIDRIISLMRLAPMQCVGWGHPITTGSRNVDYFLSTELMETPQSDSQYSETLVRLPNIGLHLPYPDAADRPGTRSMFGIAEDKLVYGCIQSLFKYLPQYDFVFPAIAKRVKNSLFVFIENEAKEVTAQFKARQKASFAAEGLSADDYVKFVPRLTGNGFTQLLDVLDINLDSIGWTGGFITMRSLYANCPVVTLEGETLRGRHSCAMLRMIDVDDLVTSSMNDYLELAVRLGNDANLRHALTKKIEQNKKNLFYDPECVKHLDGFFKRKLRGEELATEALQSVAGA